MLSQFRICIICAALLSALLLLPLGSAVAAPSTTSTISFGSNATSTIVPFDSYDNLVIVQVEINGQGPYPFAIDTAFPSSLLDVDLASELKLRAIGGTDATKNGGSGIFVEFALSINDFSIPKQQVKVISLATVPGFLGVKIDGILGADLLSRCGVTVNYLTRAITFTRSQDMVALAGSDALPVTDSPKGISIPVLFTPQKGQPIQADVMIDTGSPDALELNQAYIMSSHVLLPTQQEILVNSTLETPNPAEKMFITRLGAIEIGRFEFKAPLTIHTNDVTPHPYAGTIGGEMLRRFTVGFDLAHGKLYLKPNESIHEPFLFDASGITLAASGTDLRTYTIKAIRPFSPAVDAQLQVGDILTNINGEAANTLTLADIKQMLEQAGTTYPATFSRGDQTINVKLVLRWLV